jgi:hypothetical protein
MQNLDGFLLPNKRVEPYWNSGTLCAKVGTAPFNFVSSNYVGLTADMFKYPIDSRVFG